jgi:hypothetical protein
LSPKRLAAARQSGLSGAAGAAWRTAAAVRDVATVISATGFAAMFAGMELEWSVGSDVSMAYYAMQVAAR